MSRFSRDSRWRDPITYAAILVMAAAAALLLVSRASWFPSFGLDRTTVLEPVIADFAEALIIAAILALTLDGYLRKRAIEQVAKEAAAGVETYYLTYGLPPEFGEEILHIRDLRGVRKDYTARLWFRNRPGDDDHLDLEIRLSYAAVNYSTEDIEFPYQWYVSEGGPQGQDRVVSASVTGADIWKEDTFSSRPDKRDIKGTVRVRPNKHNPRNRFEGCIRKVVPYAFWDVILLGEAVLNVRVKIEEIPEDLDVIVEFGHRNFAEVAMTPSENPTEWRLDQAFLPHSPMIFEWHRKALHEKTSTPKPAEVTGIAG